MLAGVLQDTSIAPGNYLGMLASFLQKTSIALGDPLCMLAGDTTIAQGNM